MQTFNLLIATPETTLYQADVISAIFPGVEGLFEILTQHAPLIAMVKPGVVEITDHNHAYQEIVIQEGFLEFSQNRGILLTMRQDAPKD